MPSVSFRTRIAPLKIPLRSIERAAEIHEALITSVLFWRAGRRHKKG